MATSVGDHYSDDNSYAIRSLLDADELAQMGGLAGNMTGLDVNRAPQVAQRTHVSVFENALGTNKNFLVYNMLSSQWTWERIKANPAALPMLYIFGMVGYALSLPLRIVIFVVAFFQIIATFFETLLSGQCRSLGDRLKFRCLVFLGATGELVFGAIGVVCPVAAYKGDEWVQSNRLIHAWYSNSYLSFWSFQIEGREVMAHDIGLGGGLGNEDRLALKKERVKADLKYYKRGYDQLSDLMHKKEMDSRDSNVLLKISSVGLLNAMQAGSSLTTFKDQALDKVTDPEEKALKLAELSKNEQQFLKYWDTFSKDSTSRARGFFSKLPFFRSQASSIAQFPYEGPRFTGEKLKDLIVCELGMDRDLMTDDENYFAGGIEGRGQIQKALMNLYCVSGIEASYEGDEEVRKHVDAYFGAVHVDPKKLKDLADKQAKLRRQPTNAQETRAKMVLQQQMLKERAALLGEMQKAHKEAGEYLTQHALLEMVTLEGKKITLREGIKGMVSELNQFSENLSHTDREMFAVVTKEVYADKAGDDKEPTE